MFCSKCGTENPAGASLCSKCGAPLGTEATPVKTAGKSPETSTGLAPNIAGLLCYIGLWISGIVFLVIEKKSKFVKFHAWQSIMTFGILSVAQIVISGISSAIIAATSSAFLPIFAFGLIAVAGVLSTIIWVLTTILWIILMIQAWNGKMWKLPGVGNWAEKQANKV